MVGLFMYANYFDLVLMRSIFKALCGIMFVLVPFLITKKNKIRSTSYFKTMIVGLIFALLGDVLLDIDNSNFGILFILGMLFFALTHVAFSVGFFKHIKFNKITFISLLCLLVPTLLLLNCFGLINAGDLTLVINVYVFIISTMVSLAITLFANKNLNKRFRAITLLGVVLFAISDLILVFALFGNNPSKLLLLSNNLIYYIAQLFVGLSFYKIKKSYK
jgi:hypothetical protein